LIERGVRREGRAASLCQAAHVRVGISQIKCEGHTRRRNAEKSKAKVYRQIQKESRAGRAVATWRTLGKTKQTLARQVKEQESKYARQGP
jgi:hypothetical protein